GLPLGVAGAGDDAPALSDRVDPALVARRGAERRPIVKAGPPVPFAVPPVRFHGGDISVRPRPEPGGFRVSPGLRVLAEGAQRRDKEPRQPDAFAAPLDADPVHSVVPVALADQREALGPRGARPAQGPDAVL